MTAPVERIASWARSRPVLGGDLCGDAPALADWHASVAGTLAELATRDPDAVCARQAWREQIRRTHGELLRRHRDEIVGRITADHPAGVALELEHELPWLVTTSRELEDERRRPLPEKLGLEYKTAVLLAALLGDPRSGPRMMRGARRALPQSLDRLAEFQRSDVVALDGARIHRRGPAAIVEIFSPRALNAESDRVLDALEICVDLALLDPRINACVLRGAPVSNRKYAGRRVFCSGINLSELYEGQLSYLYYVRRELGLVNKIYHGLACDDGAGDIEKPWISAVDVHAIGGGLQLLLVMDYVIAEQGASLSLPARKEGIIPGAANLRLPRMVGEREARRAIVMDCVVSAGSADARGFVDEVVPAAQMDLAIDRAVVTLLSSGLVSFAATRKALRIAQEPASIFLDYMSHFALAQAECHFSSALVRNLEYHWTQRGRSEEAPWK
jgi:thioesterase DpgC